MKRMILISSLAILMGNLAQAQAQNETTLLAAGLQSGGGGRGTPAAWWTNNAVVERLGLTADQKAKIERAFENHRQRIILSTETLEKEEAQLDRLLAAQTIDRNAVLSQIDRVVQARGQVERTNSAMTLEMRESLTAAQWAQLNPAPAQRIRVGANVMAGNLISLVEPAVTGVQGTVTLEAEISREGAVENLRLLSGNPPLVQAATDAVKQWRYRPTLLNGQAVAVVTTITINFPFNAGERGAAPAPAGAGQRRGR